MPPSRDSSDVAGGYTSLHHIFPGDSEMARRMRAHDWSATSLGDPLRWPVHLCVAVGLCLTSRFPILMWWGRDLQILYNDAYISFLGEAKHPWALGRAGRECWAEIWPTIGPMLQGVMATGVATWSEDIQLFFARRLPAEEVFVRFTYGPLLSPAGAVDGVFTPCTETTAAVVGARRLQMLTRLAATQAHAQDLPSAARGVIEALSTETRDSPFAALYLAEEGAEAAEATHAAVCAASTQPLAGTGLPMSVSLDASALPGRESSRDAWFDGPLARERPARLPGGEGVALPDGPLGEPALLRAIAAALASQDAEPEGILWPDARVSGGDYPERPDRWLVFPLPRLKPGASAVLVLALSSRCPLDEAYREYLQLLARHVAELLETALRRQQDRERVEVLAQLDRAKSLFFSNVSHELRTPLTLLLGPLESVLESATGAQREELLMARRNARRLHTLVDTLLDFSRLEAGRLTAQLEPTDLSAATTDVTALFRSAMEAAGLRLMVDCAALPTLFNVDRDMWEKVVSNLLSNAYKYTLAGEVRVRLRLVPGAAELSVSDTGVGISAQDQTRLFERFHRMNLGRGRLEEGTGIGLALVKELVQLHGGSIAADSDGVHGTTFTVRLPERLAAGTAPFTARQATGGSSTTPSPPAGVEPSAPSAPSTRSALSAPSTPSFPSLPSPASSDSGTRDEPRATVLVVDDNADMRYYLQRTLAPLWEVHTAQDGEEAWEAIRRRAPDVLVSDVMMPRLDGLGLVRRVRADAEISRLPIVLMSARVGDEAKVEGLQAGADDYVTKPFSTKEMVARVETQMMRSRLGHVRERFSSRLAEVLEQAPVGIAVTVGAGHLYEFANAHYRRFVPGRTLIGRTLRTNFPDLEGQGIFEIYDRVYATGEPVVVSPLQVRLRSPESGALEERHFEIVYQPLVGPDGQVNGIATVASDVHEVVRARARAEEANRAKDDFMAMLGHELRNPLAPIATALALLRRRDLPEPRELDIIDRQVQHMVRLIGDLLDVSRITQGKVELDRQVVQIAAIVDKAVETTLPLIEQRRHRMELHVPADGLGVLADPDRLCQVVANLLGNAAKFTPEGGHLIVRAERHSDSVCVQVSDNGVGMTREECEQVFGIFQQGAQRADRPLGGLGLGLSIARNLTRLHGGRLECHSEGLGRGATFSLTLPHVVQPTLPPSPSQAVTAPSALRTRRVLVVDDSVDGAESLAELLRAQGCEVFLAHDGVQALECLQRQPVELMLLDLGLPRLDGYEVAERVRANPACSAVRLVALSGFGQPSDIERSMSAGFEAHLVKPADLTKLFALLA